MRSRSVALQWWVFLVLPVGLVGAANVPQPTSGRDAALVADGDGVFAKNCSVPYCHGKDGTAGRAPAMRDRTWQVAKLDEIVRKGVPNSSMPNWDDKLSERQLRAVVAYIVSISAEAPAEAPVPPPQPASAVQAPEPAGGLPDSIIGSAARGESLFFQSGEKGCAACHSVDGKGNTVGPDLSGSARRSPRDLFRDIVYPGAAVAPGQRLVRITLRDGEKIAALKHEENATALRVYDLASLPPSLRRLARADIAAIEPEARSAMPERYAEILTLRELLDLVSFLKSSGAASPARVTALDIQ